MPDDAPQRRWTDEGMPPSGNGNRVTYKDLMDILGAFREEMAKARHTSANHLSHAITSLELRITREIDDFRKEAKDEFTRLRNETKDELSKVNARIDQANVETKATKAETASTKQWVAYASGAVAVLVLIANFLIPFLIDVLKQRGGP